MIKANEYFEGKVKSLGNSVDNKDFTVGIIEAGEFTFGTSTHELMEIIMGEMEASLPDGTKKTYKKGESFSVPKNKEFTVNVKEAVSYLCIYS
jgi:uncharacterized protein YaiE (UPF0345 family)